ncbi:tetratricopeptide repeat protein [Allokutzneria sp. NRRL B-24872]|uniref:AfsR/SARP family transcriptional regulator n=1 Tax=Allokutzneria sp. NRRL B-24872 TaxID=1137961 RepID=UPI00143CFB58|nr:tetratricopeptide repeat protein [Allokutzneria sp. NRRL B-24872]
MTVEFKVLGSLEVVVDGVVVPLNASKQRVVLAALLFNAGRWVRTKQLIDYLWERDAPKDAHNAVQTHVARLRRALGVPDLIRTLDSGYRIDVRTNQVDLLLFRELVERASEQAVDVKADLLRRATDLWRGQSLLDVPSSSLRDTEFPALETEFLGVLEQRIDAELELGKHGVVVGELRALTNEHPFRERFWAQLMLALYRCGRQAEALGAFREAARCLGSVNGAELRALHRAMLLGEIEVRQPDAEVRVVPQQLPADLGDFVGRAELLDHVVGLFDPMSTRARVLAVSGPPGVGKSAFAVRVGHRVAKRFPDGQLHVNLHGYSAGIAPSVEQVVSRFLRALGTAPQAVPTDVDEQVAKLREELASRRVLVVLDNAADDEQVLSLLDALAGCSVLITSRNELRKLAESAAARTISLPVLEIEDSLRLLRELAGEWPGPENRAARELASLCCGLPLALRVAGANLAFQAVGVEEYVGQLKSGDLLTALSIEGDTQAAVRATLELSYGVLDDECRQLFNSLALVPGADFTAWAAAALTSLDRGRAASALDRLAVVNLVHEHRPGRYQFHDLIRLFSREMYSLFEGEVASSAQRRTLFDAYLASVNAAAEVLNPEIRVSPLGFESRPELVFVPASAAEALAWLDEERLNLIAVARSAVELGPAEMSWKLAFSMTSYLRHRRYNSEWLAFLEHGQAGVAASPDEHGRAFVLTALGIFNWATFEPEKSIELHQRALPIYRNFGDREGEAHSCASIGVSQAMLGRQKDAINSFLVAERINRELEKKPELSNVLASLGAAYAHAGEIDRARDSLEASLELAAEHGVLHIQGIAASNLGLMAREDGRLEESRRLLERACEVWSDVAARHGLAAALDELALTHLLLGDLDTAADHVEKALAIAVDTGNKIKEGEAAGTLAQICHRRGDLEAALLLQKKSVHLFRSISSLPGVAVSLTGLATALLAHGRVSEALDAASEALDIAVENEIRICEPMALTSLAECSIAADEPVRAVEYGERALAQHRVLRHRVWEARTLRVIGQALWVSGDRDGAREHWERARVMFAEMGMPEGDEVRELLGQVR